MDNSITGQKTTTSQYNRDVYATTSNDLILLETPVATQVRQAIGDTALGIGHAVSVTREYRLLEFAPKISRIMAGAPRFMGAGVTLATSGYEVAKTFISDLDRGGRDFTRTRNELVATSAAVGSGVLMGTLAGIGGAAWLPPEHRQL